MYLKTDERIRGRRLQERRARFFADNPLCAGKYSKHGVREARILDHVVPLFKGGSEDDPDNWQGLCLECNRIKTNSDIGSNKLAWGEPWPQG